MRPILFSIGSLNIYGYGLMFALGILAGVWLTMHLAKQRGDDADFIFNMAVWVVVFGFLGSKLLHLLTVFPDLIEDPIATLKESITQGFVVYGSSIAGILTIFVYCRKHKKNMWKYTDLAMPGLALGQAIGRVGCLLAGCCYGMRYDGACAIHFPEGSSAPSGVGLFPVQPISAVANLLLMVILLLYLNRNRIHGRVTALWMMLYSLGRGLIEIVRSDPRGSVGVFSTSQFISLILFIVGAALYVYLTKRTVPLDPVLELDDGEDESWVGREVEDADYAEPDEEAGEIDLVDLSRGPEEEEPEEDSGAEDAEAEAEAGPEEGTQAADTEEKAVMEGILSDLEKKQPK